MRILIVFSLLGIIVCASEKEPNTPPKAFAGFDQIAYVNEPVVLSGALSRDFDHDVLSFEWSMVGEPAGAVIHLSGDDKEMASFVPKIEGIYVFALVVSDGIYQSNPDLVSVHALEPSEKPMNQPPSARAGQNINFSGEPLEVELNGSESFDPDGTQISYHWEVVAFDYLESEAQATITDPYSAVTNMRLPEGKYGYYTASLYVNDGMLQSLPDFVTVNHYSPDTGNIPPIADAGTARRGYVEREITLDGKGSDEDGEITGYKWSFEMKPSSSVLTNEDISGSLSPEPSFTPDVSGLYILRVEVKDNLDMKSGGDFVAVGVSGGK